MALRKNKTLRNIENLEMERSKLIQEEGNVGRDKALFDGKLKELHTYMDPSGLTLEQVIAKLKMEDPARYRRTMEDLKWTGEDPNW